MVPATDVLSITWPTNLYAHTHYTYVYCICCACWLWSSHKIDTFSLLIFMTRLADNDLILHSSNATKWAQTLIHTYGIRYTIPYGFIHIYILHNKQGHAYGLDTANRANNPKLMSLLCAVCLFIYFSALRLSYWILMDGANMTNGTS